MKVLITGMTARTCGRYDPLTGDPEDRRNYLVGVHALAWAVRTLGHDLDYRPVDPLESLREYDRAVVFVGPLVDPSYVHMQSGLAALVRRPDAVHALDVWKIGTSMSSFTLCVKWNYHYLWHATFAASRRVRDAAYGNPVGRKIERLVEKMATGTPWKHKMVVPLFPWGDANGLKGCPKAEVHVGLDYSPAMVRPPDLRSIVADMRSSRTRRRAWVFAAMGLRPWFLRQRYSWPVLRAGYGGPRISEHDLLRAAAGAWGYVAARYPHSPGGWWRPRFVHAAWTRSVVHCAPDEATARAAPDLYGMKAERIESLTDSGLEDLADAQARFIQRRTWKKEQLLEAVREILK